MNAQAKIDTVLRGEPISADPAYRAYAEWMERQGPLPRFVNAVRRMVRPRAVPAE